MDIDQLKLILETVGGAGEGAFLLALFLIGRGYFIAILVFSCVVYLLLQIRKMSVAWAAEDIAKNKAEANLALILAAAKETTQSESYYRTIPAVIKILRNTRKDDKETK